MRAVLLAVAMATCPLQAAQNDTQPLPAAAPQALPESYQIGIIIGAVIVGLFGAAGAAYMLTRFMDERGQCDGRVC